VTGRARLAVAVAAVSLLVVTGVVLLGAGVWAGAPSADRAALARVLREQVALLAIGGVVLLGLLGWLVVRLFRGYLLAPRRFAADARLIATVNPDHRLGTDRRPADLADLAAAVNDLADRYRAAERALAAPGGARRAARAQERNRLAALMSELAAAVLVCNAEGRILLNNAAARRLLEDQPQRPGVVGLGRSVFGVVDRDLVAHVLDRASAGVPAHATTIWGDRTLRVGVAPVAADDDSATGFVVLVEDVTRRTETARRRDALLRELTEAVRAATAAVRGAIENLLDYPDMAVADRERFAGIVRDEVVALGERVDQLTRRSADDLIDRSLHEDMSAADLLGAVAQAVTAAGGPRITVERSRTRDAATASTANEAPYAEAPGDGLWLSLDGYSAVRAIAALLTPLRTQHGLDEVALRLELLEPQDRYAALTVRWRGAAVDAETLREWSAAPTAATGTDPIVDVLARHEAQVWSRAEPDGRAHLRMLLPLAGNPVRVAPPGTPPTPPPEEARPEFYDFDLFRATDAEAGWGNRSLDEIAYTVFDTETTGLEPAEGDEIIAIGAVRIVNGRLLRHEVFDRLIDPRRSVSAAARHIHGITADMLRGQPTIDEVLPAFARFAEETVLVGHNVSFDLAFLRLKQAQTGVALTQPVLDTLLLSAAAHPDHDEHTMEAIAARLGVDVVGRHSALGDALVTGEIFIRLLRILRQQGIDTVGQAREAARRTYHARVDKARYGRGLTASTGGSDRASRPGK
jgi:DNA polymerase-3 subunit epsilon